MYRPAIVVLLPFVLVAALFGQRAWALSDQRAALAADNAALSQEVGALAAKVARIEPLRAELRALEENVARYIRILPAPEVATEERLLEMVQDVRERARFVGLAGCNLRPARTAERKSASGFLEIAITAQGSAYFEELLRFLNLLERQESFVRVNAFTARATEPGEDRPPPLDITLDLSTFRYVAGK